MLSPFKNIVPEQGGMFPRYLYSKWNNHNSGLLLLCSASADISLLFPQVKKPRLNRTQLLTAWLTRSPIFNVASVLMPTAPGKYKKLDKNRTLGVIITSNYQDDGLHSAVTYRPQKGTNAG